jgi:hypothetical protein
MKAFFRQPAAALFLLLGLNAFAAPYPSEPQLRAAAGNVAELLKMEDIELEIVDALAVGLTQPLFAAGLTPTGAVCRIFFNTTPENGLIQFFAAFDATDFTVLLNALAVHEAMHCLEQREAIIHRHFDRVLPVDFKPDTATIQGYLAALKSGALVLWSEALADIASLLYLQQAVPDRWSYFAHSLAAMRRDYAGKWPDHDTSPWLYKFIADADRAGAQSLFETALQMRSQYRPRQ